jgi:hypothetical protein
MRAQIVSLLALIGSSAATATWAEPPQVLPLPTYAEGDTWVFDRTHLNGAKFTQERVALRVERVSEDKIILGGKLDGAPGEFEDHLVNRDMSETSLLNDKVQTTNRLMSFPMHIGDTWKEDFVDPRHKGPQQSAHIERTSKVIGWEDVTVPAGTFHALKIETNGKLTGQMYFAATAVGAVAASPDGSTGVAHTERAHSGEVTEISYRVVYYVPELKYYVKAVNEQYNAQGVRVKRDTSELVSFKAGS